LPAWHIAKESIQLFHMQASILPTLTASHEVPNQFI
jgi:hypothetical protein